MKKVDTRVKLDENEMMKWQFTWIHGGKIKEIVWVDRDVIAWHSGINIIFLHLINKEQTFFSCSQSPDGCCCIAGHPTKNIVAFAEKSRNPRIMIYTYPNMTEISECCEGSENGYLATAFASTDFLVSLGSYPSYSIIIWNWKNGNKLFSIPTPIYNLHEQIIRVSSSQPILIAQLGRDTKELLVWTVKTTSTIIMSYERITLPYNANPVYVDWSSHQNDPKLAITDEHGHVYISNKDGSEINRVVFSQRCGVCLEYEVPIVVWFQDGIILKTTFCQIRYYKKNEENHWRRERYSESKLKPYIITVNPFRKDELFYFTDEGFLMQMSLSGSDEVTLRVDKKFEYGGIYTFMDFIYPWANDSVVIDTNLNFNIINVKNGRIIGRLEMELDGKITHLVSHLDYPLVALITTNGELYVITIHRRDNPSILLKYKLQSEQLDVVKFSACGKHLIVCDKTSGICYCITSLLNQKISKIHKLEIEQQIIDVVLYDEKGILKILALLLTSTVVFVGNFIFTYELLPNTENFIQSKNITQLPEFYQYIHYTPGNSRILVTSPYHSRKIHFLSRITGMKLDLIKSMMSGHYVRGLKIYTNRHYITTSGIDGVVTVLTGQTHTETPTILSTHHRGDLGVSKAICSPSGNIIIALGRNGSVVCLEVESNYEQCLGDKFRRGKTIRSDYASLNEDILSLLSEQCQIIPPLMGKSTTWIEWEKEKILLREEDECRGKKLEIYDSFNKIKIKIQNMLDENEKCQDIDRLSVSAFDLAIFAREQKIKLAREERETVRMQLEFKCLSMNKITEWIKTTFWDPQTVVSKSIYSIFSNDKVTNYPTVSGDPQEKEMFMWNEYLTDLDINVNYSSFEMKRCSLIKNRYKSNRLDEKSIIESLLIDDDEYENEEEKKIEQQACEGVTTHRFIKPSSQYSQFEDYSFSQFLSMTNDMNNDIQELKNYFNKLFEKMYEVKKQEVASFHERNKKIYLIDTELRTLFNESVPEILQDPQWHSQEKPESIINILDEEVMVEPYISPSQQELAKIRAEEEEKMRLALMADDFRERLLQIMMDGVLEVRWEDIIKKDIPKPQCMITKSPEEYNTDDIIAVQKYDTDMHVLMQEREKYRRILKAEFSKITKILKEDVEKFNSSLRELSLIRIKIESAIQQLNLLRSRSYLRAFQRLTKRQDIINCQQKIFKKRNEIERILDENKTLQELLPDLRSQREILLTREKMMLKQFKTEFHSLGKITIELLRKQYKRRPKLSMKHTTADDLLELGKCIITSNNSKFLNHYCMEYLTGVDVIDVKPCDLPESITPHYWSHLIKIRRNKIELEMSLKANWIEINEIDRGIADNKKKIDEINRDIYEMENKLIEMNKDQNEFDLNIEIQLVLTMGQIEINTSGDKKDTKNAILLPRDEIVRLNNKILQTAEEKLKIMKRTMKFNKGKLYEKWQHKSLKMIYEDLQDELREIKNFSLTKDTRTFFNRQLMGFKDNRTSQQLAKQMAAIKMTLEKSLKEEVVKLEKIEAKIEMLKKKNFSLDNEITRMNVKRWELEFKRDLEAEDRSEEFNKKKMAIALYRSRLVMKIQEEYAENLELQAEYERLRLQKNPEISWYKIIDA